VKHREHRHNRVRAVEQSPAQRAPIHIPTVPGYPSIPGRVVPPDQTTPPGMTGQPEGGLAGTAETAFAGLGSGAGVGSSVALAAPGG
jgi:hypothetical protein